MHELINPCTVLETIYEYSYCSSYLVSVTLPSGTEENRFLQVFPPKYTELAKRTETALVDLFGRGRISLINGYDGADYLLVDAPAERRLQWNTILAKPLGERIETVLRLGQYLVDSEARGSLPDGVNADTFFAYDEDTLQSWDLTGVLPVEQAPENRTACMADLALLAAQAMIGKAVAKDRCLLQTTLALHNRMPGEYLQSLIQTLETCLMGAEGATLQSLLDGLSEVPIALEIHESENWENVDPNLAAANFLQKHPLWRYVRKDKNGDKELHILMVGATPMRKAFLDTIIPCAQMLDTQMYIHVVAEDGLDFSDRYLKKAPLLAQGVEITHIPPRPDRVYTLNEDITGKDCKGKPVPFAHLTFEKAAFPKASDLRDPMLGCVLLLDPYTDQMRQAMLSLTARGSRSLLIGLKDPVPPREDSRSHVEVDSFAEDHNTDLRELGVYREGWNVHYFYTKSYNERVTYRELSREFSKKYNRNSSIRSALSIPYKLEAYGLADCEDKAVRFCREVLSDETRVRRLIWLEHRSWQAYLMVYGWYLNTETFDEDFAAHGYSHKDKCWHGCLFGSNDNGKAPLSQWSMDDWDKRDISSLDALDAMSVKVHRLLTAYVENQGISELKDLKSRLKTRLPSTDWQQTENALKSLQTNVTNAFVGWNRVMGDVKWNLKQNAPANTSETMELLKELQGWAKIINNRNQCLQFKDVDRAIIEGIPYLLEKDSVRCIYKLWTPEEHPWKSLSSSFFLEPEQLILLTGEGETVTLEQQQGILAFLRNRRNLRTILRVMPMKSLKKLCQNAVLDVTGADTEQLLCAVNRLKKLKTTLPLIQFKDGKLYSLDDNCPILEFYPCNQKLTVEEMMAVTGTTVLSENGTVPMHHLDRYNELWNIAQISEKYNLVSEFLSAYKSVYKVWPNHYKGRRSPNAWRPPCTKVDADRNGLLELLTSLYKAAIINPLEWNRNEDTPNITAVNPRCQARLNDMLDAYIGAGKKCRGRFYLCLQPEDPEALCALEDLQLEFNKSFARETKRIDGRDIDFLRYTDGKHNKEIEWKLVEEMLRNLEQKRMIQPVDNNNIFKIPKNPGGLYNIRFRYADVPVMDCLTKAGNVLEALAYHTVRQMDVFDDVKLGVSILWSQEIEPGIPTRNEIDLICTKGTKSFFISCKKTVKLDPKCITEIRYETDRFGVDGTAILLTTAVEEENRAAYARARRMGVEVITLKDYVEPGKTPEISHSILSRRLRDIIEKTCK